MFLLRLHRFALRLQPLVPWCYALGLCSAVLALLLLVRDDSSQQLLGIALGITVWSLMAFAFIRLFQSIPPPVLPKDSWFERLRSRCKLALYHVLAFGVALVTVALVAMSLKLLSASI